MLRFKICGDTRTLIGLGLSATNIERLKKGDPVLVKLDSLGIEAGHDKPIDIMIMTGDTEAHMLEVIKKEYGFDIGPETKVNIDPRTTQ